MMAAFRFSRWSWLNSLSALAFGSVDRVLVGGLMGPAALAIYTVGVQVGQMIHTASVAVFQKAMPRVSRLLAAPPFPAPPNARSAGRCCGTWRCLPAPRWPCWPPAGRCWT